MRIDVRPLNDFSMLAFAVFLGGCSSLSGVGGDAHYACPAPPGVQCESVTANYQQSLHRELPTQSPSGRIESISQNANTATTTAARLANADIDSATPLYSPPRTLTLWVAPWEDRDNVLHDAAFVHVPIDHGHWMIDPVRPLRRLESRAIKPPRRDMSVAPTNPDSVDPSSITARPSSPAQTDDSDAR